MEIGPFWHHDWRLIAIAALIGVIGVRTALSIAAEARRSLEAVRWTAVAAISLGTTLWAVQFLTLVAWRMEVPVAFAPWPTLGALPLAIFGSFAGLYLATGAGAGAPVGGAVFGMTVALLQQMAVTAMGLPAGGGLILDSASAPLLFAPALGAGAFWWAFGGATLREGWGALVIVLTIAAVQLSGLDTLVVAPGGRSADGGIVGLARLLVAAVVSLAALAVIALGGMATMVERRISSAQAADTLRLRRLTDATFEGLIIHSGLRVVDVNARFEQMLALDRATLLERDFMSWLDPEAPPPDDTLLERADQTPVEVVLRRGDGTSFTAEIMSRPLDGSSRVLAVRDVSARKAAEERMQHLAMHDALTDLPNRRLFFQLAIQDLAVAQRTGRGVGFLLLDLDGLRLVNDLHGHAIGDALLKAVAARLQAELGNNDVIARFGGDEFAIMLPGGRAPAALAALAETLLAETQRPLQTGATRLQIGASIGIALYPQDGVDAEELLRNAETAMHRAKADGRGMLRFFEQRMDAALADRRLLESRLRASVATGSLAMAYQPLVDAASGVVVSFEALMRWQDAELGPVSPGRFIPIAEDTGLIVPLGQMALATACRTAAGWPEPLKVAVNLSAVQFRRPGLVETVAAALAESGLAGPRLELEITESLLIDDKQQVLDTLASLKQLGVSISMDDFGTGYSSLGYLQSFPFDKLKIDRMFVTDLDRAGGSAPIVRAVTAIGRSFGMRVVAEGVETELQAAVLRELGVSELQGFLIARALPADAIPDFLERRRAETLRIVAAE